MTTFVAFGPPGTGKTEFCVQTSRSFIEQELASKEEIAFVAFGKKAANDAATRCGITGDERRKLWYRTLHSTCYKLLGLAHGQVVTPSKLRDFGKKIGLEVDTTLAVEDDEMADLAEVLLAVQKQRSGERGETSPSKVLATYQLSRLLSRTEVELLQSRKSPHPRAIALMAGFFDARQYAPLIELYERWKAQSNFTDFVDMLEQAVTRRDLAIPAWRYAFTDEAQDLAPLQWAVVDRLFIDRCESVFLAGDDDQAIMAFQGASARDFLAYRDGAKRIHLRQTHRFGEEIVRFGARIAERLSEREPKDILPDPGKVNVIRNLYRLERTIPGAGRRFFLHRHVVGCAALAKKLILAGEPFWNERGINPLARKAEIDAYLAFSKLSRGEPLRGYEVAGLLHLVPSYKTVSGKRVQLVKHGSKKKLADAAGKGTVSRSELEPHFMSPLWNAISRRDWSVVHVEFPEYYERLEKKGINLNGELKIDNTITTIHGSKGREADTVLLFTEVTPRCLRGEDEHRVAYVGATRTAGDLYLVWEQVTPWSTTHYPYPNEEGR